MKNGVKIGISLLILVAFIGIATYLVLNSIEIAGYNIRSLADYEVGIEDLKKSETTYTDAVTKETRAKNDLKSKMQTFESEKEKYNNITDETINLIKDATKIEKYSIEYLWVRIGNYASKYKLGVSIVEPGNTVSSNNNTNNEENNNGTTEGENNGTEQVPGGSTENNTGGTEQVPGGTTNPDINNPTNDSNNEGNISSNAGAGVLTIRVTGAYKSICDFIYLLETDSTLRFKLENMDISGADNVTANFEIKDMQILM